MNVFHAIILGIVEGITEFLPISSTAHITFAEYFLDIPQTEFLKSFSVIIQIGAILSVVTIYGRRFLKDRETNKRVLVAFLPTAVIGFILYKIIKSYFIGNLFLSIGVLGVGGLLLIFFERYYRSKSINKNLSINELSYKQAFFVGLGQSLAVVPGLSRSATTIVGGLFCGLKRGEAVEFSFLLALPTMLAATGYDFLKNYQTFNSDQFTVLLVGLLTSFIFGLIGIKFLVKISNSKSLEGFGWYRIIFAIIFVTFIL